MDHTDSGPVHILHSRLHPPHELALYAIFTHHGRRYKTAPRHIYMLSSTFQFFSSIPCKPYVVLVLLVSIYSLLILYIIISTEQKYNSIIPLKPLKKHDTELDTHVTLRSSGRCYCDTVTRNAIADGCLRSLGYPFVSICTAVQIRHDLSAWTVPPNDCTECTVCLSVVGEYGFNVHGDRSVWEVVEACASRFFLF